MSYHYDRFGRAAVNKLLVSVRADVRIEELNKKRTLQGKNISSSLRSITVYRNLLSYAVIKFE